MERGAFVLVPSVQIDSTEERRWCWRRVPLRAISCSAPVHRGVVSMPKRLAQEVFPI